MLDFLTAIGLVLAIEGLLLAAFPEQMRRAMLEVAKTPELFLRRAGIVSAIVGVIVVFFVRSILGGG
jgi:uncharacterized protein YjeT (DUF2065 family)